MSITTFLHSENDLRMMISNLMQKVATKLLQNVKCQREFLIGINYLHDNPSEQIVDLDLYPYYSLHE